MAKGIIYITTTSVTGLIKIGKTQSNQFETRMATLEQNGYWNVNGLHRYFAVEVDDYDEKEKLLHTVFSKSQVSTSELFALDKNLAKAMLESFDGTVIYPKIIEKEQTATKKRHTAQPNLTFKLLHIPIGAMLSFTGDESLKVTVIDEINKVRFQNIELSLSSMARFLFEKIGKANSSGAYQGGAHFKYNGKTLVTIRNQMKGSL